MGDSSFMRRKNIGQVKLFWDSCKIWSTKVHSNLLTEINLPTNEKFFSEAPVVSHGCWQNNKENSGISDREIVSTKKRVNKTYPLKDEESYIVATSEIDGAYGILRDIQTFTDELQQVFYDLGGKIIGNGIKPSSAQSYSRRLI